MFVFIYNIQCGIIAWEENERYQRQKNVYKEYEKQQDR